MVLSGRSDIDAVGRYREYEDAMQVVSGALHKPAVHFEAPPSSAMASEMETFSIGSRRAGPGGKAPSPPSPGLVLPTFISSASILRG